MKILKGIKYSFSFLTRIPLKIDSKKKEEIAQNMWIFPIVGVVLGLISSFICLILLKFLPNLLAGFIILGLLLLITGAHHTDGLIDFGDGLMATGPPERKIEVIHDVAIGTGGFTLGLIVLSLTGIAISFSDNHIIISLVLSEIGAKFSMVAACSIGKSGKTEMVDVFIRLNKKKHMFFSLILSLFSIYLILIINWLYILLFNNILVLGFIFTPINEISPLNLILVISIFTMFLIGTFFPLIIIIMLANRNFNGLTGDCLGALNDITRLFILILVLLMESLSLI